MSKTTAIVVSDTHINSRVALCTPLVNLDDGGTYRSSRTQRALWEAWLDFWDTVGKSKSRKVLFINGDMGELDTKNRSHQLITRNKATIMRMAIDVFEPALDVADRIIVVRGTPAHAGKSSWVEEAIANDLDTVFPDKDSSSWRHFRGKIENVPFDVAHHANMGGLPWTEKHAANKVAKIIIDRYAEMKAYPPKVAFRAHNHRRSDSGRNFPVKVICGPCWSSHTEYIFRIAHENDIPDIGGDVVICEDGNYEWIDYHYKVLPMGRRIWSLKV